MLPRLFPSSAGRFRLPRHRLALAICLAATASPLGAQQVSPGPGLQYRFEAGRKLVYSVDIELDRGDVREKLSGTPAYSVQSVDGQAIGLEFRGNLESSLQPKDDSRSSLFRIRRPPVRLPSLTARGDQPSELVVNPQGRLVSLKGSSQLPGLLGNLSLLMIEPLPDAGQTTWRTDREVAIVTSDVRMLRPSFLPAADEDRLTAKERCRYTIEATDAERATIRRQYELATLQTIEGQPRFEISGQGSLVFDFRQGVLTRGQYEQKVTIREENQVTTVPVTVLFRLLDEAEIQQRLAQKKEQALAAAERAIAALDGADRNQLLGLLRGLDDPEAGEPNAALTAKLAPLLKHEDTTVRYMAAKALEVWASPEAAPALLDALQDELPTVRNLAMDTLARLQTPAAISPIARRLADKTDRFRATEALKKFGAAAEDATLEQLDDADWMTRLQAVRVLQEIGTAKSRPALTEALTDEQALIRNEAQRALDTLR